MEDDPLRYDLWIEDALRTVIRRALTLAAEQGLPGEHHYYVTFRTDDEGVEIPQYLHADHPEEMTIVLQYQYDNLRVDDDALAVTLHFNGKPERLVVPLSAVTSFSDPYVNFGLQLKMTTVEGSDMDLEIDTGDVESFTAVPGNQDTEPRVDGEQKSGEVIALDAFRKK
jgi:hypothetical protein